MSDKKVCEVCGREAALCRRCTVPNYAAAWPTDWQAVAECYRLGFERERAKAAILTPEVLRLIEAGEKYRDAYHDESRDDRPDVALLLQAALALPFEKPADKRNG